ncbi:conserved hypothetical protein [Cupriavidus taiwanensis]|uniref:hypothetical protein n=1 Tax=Cupriavidus taiwanensis TaxID=164546 RepID=UPI000E188932|nr:hypothetical protein [Cupriavidus taiwanensis]SOZ98946.1 conserved hypothetical protein [Cupriavidus taiwanensis]
MMAGEQIQPHKVTKPIQLLAAWLIGLVLTVGIFLTTALKLEPGSWERGALVVAAIVDVPVFLFALFLLQTKFRAELQEDSFYSEYLSKKTAAIIHIEKGLSSKGTGTEQVVDVSGMGSTVLEDAKASIAGSVNATPWGRWKVGLNVHHPKATEIAHALRQDGMPIAEMFGTTQLPQEWVISLSHDIPARDVVRLLKAVLRFGFAGVAFWHPQYEAGETEDVYIGSYANRKYIPISDELVALVSGEFDEVAFKVHVARHSVTNLSAD